MATYYEQYKRACLVEVCTPDMPTCALSSIHSLDDQIRAEFNGMIQSYEQGLCHSVEFFEALAMILHRSRA